MIVPTLFQVFGDSCSFSYNRNFSLVNYLNLYRFNFMRVNQQDFGLLNIRVRSLPVIPFLTNGGFVYISGGVSC
jgi:hypothetical protein